MSIEIQARVTEEGTCTRASTDPEEKAHKKETLKCDGQFPSWIIVSC